MRISSVLKISVVALLAMLFNSCNGKPQSWMPKTHPRCQWLKGSSLEQINCPANMRAVKVPISPNDFLCDCPPYSVYFSTYDSCHELFKQGPCPEQHFVSGLYELTCEKNPCTEKDQLPYEGSCYKLGDTVPCPDGQYLSVNWNFHRLECHPKHENFYVGYNDDHGCIGFSLRERCALCTRMVG